MRDLGLTPLQLSLIGTVLMLTTLLFELPTGVIADVYGRKRSVLLGGALIGVCFVLVSLGHSFTLILLGAFSEALGGTLISGALDAWIADEVGPDKVGRVLVRATQIGSIGHWAGIGASVLLATVAGLRAPILLGGVLWLILTAFLWRWMPETAFVRAPRKDGAHWLDAFATTAREALSIVRRSRTLRLLFATQLFIGAFVEVFGRLFRAHLLSTFTFPAMTLPVIGVLSETVWFALLDAAVSLLYLGVTVVLKDRLAPAGRAQSARVLMACYALALGCAALFAATGQFALAFAAALGVNLLLLLAEPATTVWLNLNLTSATRATVLSMTSQTRAFGALGGGPALGATGAAIGTRAAMAGAMLLLMPVVALLGADAARSGDDR